MKKVLLSIAALLMVVPLVFPVSSSAQTVSELQAQINSLLATLTRLQAQLNSLQGGTAQNFVFTSDLTIGSRGTQVSELQEFLVNKGFLTMPTGVAFGYFGTLTRSALASFQASQSISPAAGYFGSITRTKINSILAGQTPTTPSTGGNGISTPGVEGIMAVTPYSAGLRSTVYEGEQQIPILGMKITAKQSDIAVQRIRINLGNSSTIYNRILSKLYVTDGSNVLASTDLNSSTVLREGGTYFVTISGFNYVVPKNGERNIVIDADVRSAIDTTYQNTPITIQLADDGVRGIDGAGIEQFSPDTGSSISRSIQAQESLTESALLKLSLSDSTPLNQDVVANSGANNNEEDKLALLAFNVKAERDNVTITDMQINVAKTGSGTANASSTVYLFDGSTEIDNASVTNGNTAIFQNLDYTIPKDTTRTLTVKVDIRNANSAVSNFTASIPTSSIIVENSIGDQLSSSNISGSAIGYTMGVHSAGAEVTLLSKSITTNGVPQGSGNNFSTSIMMANFSVKIRAVGSDVMFGLPASSTPAFDSSSFKIYRNGAPESPGTPVSISYTVPSGATTAGQNNSFIIPEGNEVTLNVAFQILGRKPDNTAITSGLYSIGLENIHTVANGTPQDINFMAGDTAWRTVDVSFP